MVQFVKLRLSGFKSFVEPTELLIEPGTTGIVGPNGCGKSNLVEALRWVMGETSAKRLRGGEMDDVIFGGTSSRPARALAEVMLALDNSDRLAPVGFNEQDVLEVVRRIERERGSSYRVNGREVRARDVQLLFADAASGSQSTAIVSQGRVGALINAKATDRRHLLEEAAGITGLHSRRHEAELRLKAAETNLERLEDVVGTLENQLGQLRRQARQAVRYRNIAQALRREEALLLYLEMLAGREAERRAAEALREAERVVAGFTEQAAASARAAADAQSALPPLRQLDAEAAAVLQRLLLERDSLQREAQQVAEQRGAAEQRLAQLRGDLQRAGSLGRDAEEAIARLDAERAGLQQAVAAEGREQEAAASRRDGLAGEVAAAEETLARLTQQVAADEARRGALNKRIGELREGLARLVRRGEEAARERGALESARPDASALQRAAQALEEADGTLEARRGEVEAAEVRVAALRGEETRLREQARACDAAVSERRAERKTIAGFLDRGGADLWPPVVDAVTVEPGWEPALGAALGDDLEAPTETSAPFHWRALDPYADPPALPEGCSPLAARVQAPAALARRLAQVGIVEDAAEAARLQPALHPGQRLVSRAGALWRWDGFTAGTGAPTAGAQRLAQRNRLAEVESELEEAERVRAAAVADHETVQQRLRAAVEAEKAVREAQRQAFARQSAARDEAARLEQRAAAEASRLAALEEQAVRLEEDRRETAERLAAAEAEVAGLPDLAAARQESGERRAALAERRTALAEAEANALRLRREAEARAERLQAIEREAGSWRKRLAEAGQHSGELEQRRQAAEAELAALAERPEEIAARRAALAERIAAAEAARQAAATALAEGENAQAQADRAARGAEQHLAEARETRVRAEATVAQAGQAMGSLAERVREKLEIGLGDLGRQAELQPDQPLPEREEIRRKVERLQQERERIGPVNLRAEQEAEELAQRIESMTTERDDLVAAISRLRQGISGLNREGRQRLLAAFEQVQGHFSELFVRLFGGGQAHLELTEADDPLDAGLEIMASPPGKKLQVLSLLSGGEQALTALALLFAVFLTNPAPVCVLDEVDAPLDDSNVDRFCDLVDELAHSLSTRFLLITHHRLTMARVDRLFGVTMTERGVSQLVSVDLEAAAALRESA